MGPSAGCTEDKESRSKDGTFCWLLLLLVVFRLLVRDPAIRF